MNIAKEIKSRFSDLLVRYLEEGLTLEEERELLALPVIHQPLENEFSEGFELLKSKIRKLRFLDISWKIQDSTASKLDRAEHRALLKDHPELSNFYRDICMIKNELMLAVAEEHHQSQRKAGQELSKHESPSTQRPRPISPASDFGADESFKRSTSTADSFSHEPACGRRRIRDVSYDGFCFDPHDTPPNRSSIQPEWNDSMFIELVPQLGDNP